MRKWLWLVMAGALAAVGNPALGDGFIVAPEARVSVPGSFSFAPLDVTFHRVNCEIKDQVAVTKVDQEFHNESGARVEGDYIFPVPADARIDKFRMDIDGTMVDAELIPADKARHIYEEIVRKARDPALLEYAGRAMFRVHIFPIEPHGKKRIQLQYTELLKQTNGLLDYHYTLDTEKYSLRPLEEVSIAVTINSATPLTTLYSPSHEVDIKRKDATTAVVAYEEKGVRPDRDFHLFIGRKQSPVGLSVLTYRPEGSNEGYFALMAAPTLSDRTTTVMPKDVVFTIDTSGSMSGEKIDQARKALKYCISTLNDGDRFDVVRFSTDAEPLFGHLTDASPEQRKKAIAFAEGLHADGGTAIDEALKQAIGERAGTGNERLFMVVFMTDGQPTIGEENPATILDHVTKASGDGAVRIFSFGVGTDVNTTLLDQVAQRTRGYSQYVLPGENLELAMSSFWGKVQDPVLANLELGTGSVAVSKVFPKQLPDLFKGDQLVAFGTFTQSGPAAVTLSGTVNGKAVSFIEDVTFPTETDSSNDWIARLWATRRVGYLLEELRQHGETAEVREEIVTLARRWGLVTPYTAMLIMEDEKKRNVPVALQSMREMSIDRGAQTASSVGIDSMRQGNSTGAGAVKDSLNTAHYKEATSFGGVASAAAQSSPRDQFEGQAGGALDKAAAAPIATDSAQKYNFGLQTRNGWQTAASAPGATVGYRAVNSYSQQSRVINNRSFFLNGNQWTDATIQQLPKAAHHKVVFGSDEYFGLLQTHPEIGAYLALGNNVSFLLDGSTYDVVDETPAP